MKLTEIFQAGTFPEYSDEQIQSSVDDLTTYTALMKKFSIIMEKINRLGKENEESPEMLRLRRQLNESRLDLLKQTL